MYSHMKEAYIQWVDHPLVQAVSWCILHNPYTDKRYIAYKVPAPYDSEEYTLYDYIEPSETHFNTSRFELSSWLVLTRTEDDFVNKITPLLYSPYE